MIDSHCHLDCDAFDEDWPAVLARAAARGLEAIVLPGVDETSWERIHRLTLEGMPRCFGAYGIHPVALPFMQPEDDAAVLERLRAFVKRVPSVAIGECGLDTTIDLKLAPMERQISVLTAQIELARQADLPLILHARGPGCYAQLLEVLKRDELPKSGGVVHSYGGGAGLLTEYLKLPLMFGFAGPATYPNARRVRESIAEVPSDRLLAETDAPDQTPEPHRPGRCEPAYVADVIAGIAAARQASSEVIARLTTDNARRLFKLA